MRKVALGDVADIVSGATPKTSESSYWDGDIEWATPADLSKLDGPFISHTPRKITRAGLESCSAQVLPEGSVLLSSRAPIGHVAINATPMATNQGFKSLIPKPGLDAKYAYHWLRANTAMLQSMGNGATFKELSKASVARMEIPFPALDEQRRIAAILDHADALRTRRRETVRLIDGVGQAIFDSMFGDGNYEQHRLDALVDSGDRMNYGVVQPGEDVPHGIPLIRVSNLVGGGVDRHTLKRIDPAVESSYARSRIRGTEILVSCVGTIGLVSLVGEADVGSNIARAVTRVPISDPVLRTYVGAYLRTPGVQRRFESQLRTVAQPTLNVTQLAATEVPVPSVYHQRDFVARLGQVETQLSALRAAALTLDEAYGSLETRAFSGQL